MQGSVPITWGAKAQLHSIQREKERSPWRVVAHALGVKPTEGPPCEERTGGARGTHAPALRTLPSLDDASARPSPAPAAPKRGLLGHQVGAWKCCSAEGGGGGNPWKGGTVERVLIPGAGLRGWAPPRRGGHGVVDGWRHSPHREEHGPLSLAPSKGAKGDAMTKQHGRHPPKARVRAGRRPRRPSVPPSVERHAPASQEAPHSGPSKLPLGNGG